MITKRFNQYLPIVCLLFLIIICLFFIVSSIDNYIIKPGQAKLSTNVYIDDSKKIVLRDKYPFPYENRFRNSNKIEKKIDNGVNYIKREVSSYILTNLPYNEVVFGWYRKYNKAIGWNYNIKADYDEKTVLKLDNGYLSNVSERANADELNVIVSKLKGFKQFLDKEGINFYYINGGCKVPEEDKHLPVYNAKFENADHNGDILIKQLRKQGINVLDIRDEAKIEHKDWYELFYRYDHHIKTENQLWVAEKISNLLEEREGFKFNKRLFSITNYNCDKKKLLFGSQARSILKNGILEELEEYTRITPKFVTNLEIELPEKGELKKGTYENCLIDDSKYKQVLESMKELNYYYINKIDAYSCMTWDLDSLGIIRNKIENYNKGKKVLILQDSFGCYTSTFLALGLEELHIINPASFSGSIHTYAKELKPNVVLMLYTSSKANKEQASDRGVSFRLD